MIYIYGSVAAVILIFVLLTRNYKKEIFANSDTKEDPMKFLFPASAWVYDFLIRTPSAYTDKVNVLMKQLYVRENVQLQVYRHKIKRIAVVLVIVFSACIVGVLLCINSTDKQRVTELERGGYGSGSRSYNLNVLYEGSQEDIDLNVSEQHLTQEEILDLFDRSIEEIKSKVLGDNESWEHIDQPLNLISDYGNIHIRWELDDTELINYNGEISSDLAPDQVITTSLFATLSMDGANQMYVIPAAITSLVPEGRDLLIKNISESMEKNNSMYSSSVELPEEIAGNKISFFRPSSSASRTIPALIMAAGLILFIGYDKLLDEKLKNRSDQMMSDFSEIVFKLGLLYEAGLSIHGAWDRIVEEAEGNGLIKDHYAYQEMKLTSEKIKSGVSEAESYSQFGRRCGLHPYIKLGNILQQNLSKGSKGMRTLLAGEAQESFEDRKRLARKKGEEAGTKMLIPMVMMLVVVIIIVAVPALMSISF